MIEALIDIGGINGDLKTVNNNLGDEWTVEGDFMNCEKSKGTQINN
jgi:hypothetical protein